MLRDLKVTSPNAVSQSQAYIQANVQVDGASNFVVERLTIVEAEQERDHHPQRVRRRHRQGQQRLTDARRRDPHHGRDRGHPRHQQHRPRRGRRPHRRRQLPVDPRRCKNITIVGNDVARRTNGRGISNVGGESVTIKNNTIAETNGAGVWSPRTGITARSARSTRRCSTTSSTRPTSATSTRAGIQIYGQPGNMAQNTLVEATSSGTRCTGASHRPNSQGALVDDNELVKIAEQGILASAARDLTVTGNTLTEIGTYGLYARNTVTASCCSRRTRSRGSTLRARVASTSSTSRPSRADLGRDLGQQVQAEGRWVLRQLVESTDPKIAVFGNTLF